ncbi:hypothetical protein Y032_0263g594 [Ancylostoma ceylanicum]|uniref:G-protein coupled receptors family 1 profile domain-containing protein n=2 Tax=Ancylostoma ceylanicum TaxID=53326 RepID=A0A016SAI2_9BILA|nr:hypothetical protein Y032_0263g594 [Ancylostoma ceylanicum]
MNISFEDHSTSWSVDGVYVKWVADLLIHNISTNESTQYIPILGLNTSIYTNISLVVFYCFVVPLNVFFFVSIVPELTRKCIMKLKLLVATLIAVNILWSLTWLCLSVAVCIIQFQETDEVMFILNAEEDGAYLRESIWEIVAHQLIENLLTVQSILIFAISIDRYLNLFNSYSTSCENMIAKLLLVVLPFIVAATVFDHRVLALLLPVESALFCRLCLLLCPSLLAVTLLLIALFPTDSKNGFEPRFPMSLSTSFPRVMLLVAVLDVFWRIAFFFQLLELDFEFRIVTGSELGNEILEKVLNVSYEVAIFIVHLFPLYFPVLLMVFVRHYRTLTSSRFSQITAMLCCKSDTIVDYRCETMRSILADQKKRRSMMMSVH